MKQIEIDVGIFPEEAEANSHGDVEKNAQQDSEPEHVAAVSAPPSSDGDPQASDEVVLHAPGRKSLFFPCNREDALLLLGSLCISEFFPDASVRLAIQPGGIALLDQGLRSSEEELIKGRRPERFPVLIEVGHHVGNRSPRVIEYSDVLGLVFRTQSEAEDFRYRPVDEFDTDSFSCRAESEIFGLPGELRFGIREISDTVTSDAGRIVDRLAAGVHCLIALGNARPDCRVAIADFLGRKSREELGKEEIDFEAAGDVLLDIPSDLARSKHQRAIVPAFASFEGGSDQHLVEQVTRNFAAIPSGDEALARMESRWVEIALDVLKSRIALAGDQLSDDRSVLLRGALLGLVVDKTDALFAFLDAEKPSGPRVTTAAAFFVGLKQGVLSLSWREKKPYLEVLSSLARILICNIVTSPDRLKSTFAVSECETESTSMLSISAGNLTLAEWTETRQVAPDVLSQIWIDDFQRHGYEVLGKGRSGYSWRLRLSPRHEVEMKHCICGEHRFPMLRFYLENGRKFRNSRELSELARNGGMFWYPGRDDDGQLFLSCDLPTLPGGKERELISARLAEALDTFLVPVKAPPKSRKKESIPVP